MHRCAPKGADLYGFDFGSKPGHLLMRGLGVLNGLFQEALSRRCITVSADCTYREDCVPFPAGLVAATSTSMLLAEVSGVPSDM